MLDSDVERGDKSVVFVRSRRILDEAAAGGNVVSRGGTARQVPLPRIRVNEWFRSCCKTASDSFFINAIDFMILSREQRPLLCQISVGVYSRKVHVQACITSSRMGYYALANG